MAHPDDGIARIVVCTPARDGLDGHCAICRQPVRFRPPVPALRVLVCLTCYIVHAEPGAHCELLGEAAAALEALGVSPPTW